jgi:hypothetical protein
MWKHDEAAVRDCVTPSSGDVLERQAIADVEHAVDSRQRIEEVNVDQPARITEPHPR